jgi:hypothetical protein
MRLKQWKIGDRVQKFERKDGKEVIHVGVISDVVTETRERNNYDLYGGYGYDSQKKTTETYVKSISVKWDDGTEEVGLNTWDVQSEDSPLEREFRIKAAEVISMIDDKLSIAAKAIDEAEAIAEEHGISFFASVSPIGQSYIAESADEKWPGISKEFRNEVTHSYGEYSGWQHSDVCY